MKPMTRKRPRAEKDDEEDSSKGRHEPIPVEFLGGGRKGVSSGLATVVRRRGSNPRGSVPGPEKKKWWKELVGEARGSIKVRSS
jgi:RNA exonuclease 4